MNIRKIICILACIILFQSSRAQQYTPADKGCRVDFKAVKHKSGDVIRGTLNKLKGSITFDPKNLSAASFDITVSVLGITSGKSDIAQELKKDIWLNPVKYPTIKIKSINVTRDRPGGIIYILHGNLTIKNATKPVNIQFMATPQGTGYLFRGSLELSKQAFNLGTKDDDIEDDISIFIEVRTDKEHKK